jgi:hypothetical protein
MLKAGSRLTGPKLWRLGPGLVLIVLSGCSHPVEQYHADDPGNILNGPARAIGLLPEPVQPKDFVVAGRPTEVQYMPVGIKPPDHPIKPKKPDEVKAMEKELDAARAAQEIKQGIDPNAKPVKAPKKPVPEKPTSPDATQ